MGSDRPRTTTGTCWRFVVRQKEEFPEPSGRGLKGDIQDLGITAVEEVRAASVYYCAGSLSPGDLQRIARSLLVDPITQEAEIQELSLEKEGAAVSSEEIFRVEDGTVTVEVGYRPGVRDPVEESFKRGALELGIRGLQRVHTAVEYALKGRLDAGTVDRICEKLLVNPTIQQVVTPEHIRLLFQGVAPTPIPIESVPILQANDTVLQRIGMDYQLSLNLEEMRAIQAYYRQEKREPTLIELETLAQTWSEHCKHKTLRGPIVYTEETPSGPRKRTIPSLLKETIVKATEELARPWCVSVFEDNSGVIRFDEEYHVCFKVETHNHPSALEPFGGAATGIGGVIRDILGTGLGAKPVASTDVFCFAPPDTPPEKVPPGMLHPRRIIKGVVAGVKDYGNKMGIPTVNGSVLFDERFVGNPLVYCGNVGLLPKDKAVKEVRPGMAVVAVGGRTGRDGIHGATFSSIPLSQESEVISSTAVQIGDPITEKRLADALLEARDEGLYAAVTDCGAGGFSSAVGEMGAGCGVRIYLEKVPLKYEGLTPAEIWISESQERMVLAVPQANLERLIALFGRHGVEAAAIGEFTQTGRLELYHKTEMVGQLDMKFLHEGVPQVVRPARWTPPSLQEPVIPAAAELTGDLLTLLGRWETCSKEWIIRRYDHEVQGGSVLKPLTGVRHQGPSDAAVLRPRLDSKKGIILSNGINFRYGDIDPYWMAVLAVEEALRQVAAVGGSLDQAAILDNFCWGDPTRVEVLGSLVRAAFGCYDAAAAFGTPFISGKDSLHNEYRFQEKTIQIPGTLLISAIAVIPDAGAVVSMDAKKAGSALYLTGVTKAELGGSSYYHSKGFLGSSVPRVDLQKAPAILRLVSRSIREGMAIAAHDLSEGGLGVAAAEMAFAGGIGMSIDLREVVRQEGMRDDQILFSESPTRFLLEVPAEKEEAFRTLWKGHPCARIGRMEGIPVFRVTGLSGRQVVQAPLGTLQEAWQRPFQGW
ncbi:MAG: phosphoribosylformylglycinamidine synthase subunit PurL [Candidatus Omnitrophica bacterium]|nr:phosphoribosylformylglycinamidine synthase subunit PurL [Candidatus Omnitrophota bacterium]